jgi:hypothetical protein
MGGGETRCANYVDSWGAGAVCRSQGCGWCVAGPVIACWCLGQRTTPGVCATIVARRSTQDIVAPFADYTRWINGLTLVQLATILLDIGGVTYRRMR